jgi:hypothetical protein
MKNKFYIMTALVISLTGCSNIEDGTQPTGNFPEDHVIRIVTEVNALCRVPDMMQVIWRVSD